MNDATISAQVHRFRDHVALYVGNGETVYVKPQDARTLGEALLACADDVEIQPNFSLSQVGTKEWHFQGKR